MNSSTRAKRLIVLSLVALMGCYALPASSNSVETSSSGLNSIEANKLSQPEVNKAYGKLPMSFEANIGQADSNVKFRSRGTGYSLCLTATEAVLHLAAFQRSDLGSVNQGRSGSV